MLCYHVQQYSEVSLEKRVGSSTLIIEGTITHTTSKWNTEQTRIITENTVEVTSVFKGNISTRTISIITFGGMVGDDFHFSPHSASLSTNQKGYFFLQSGSTNTWTRVSNKHGFYPVNKDLNPKVFTQSSLQLAEDFEDNIVNHTRAPKLSIAEYLLRRENQNTALSPEVCDDLPPSGATIEFTFDNVQYTSSFTYIEFDIMAAVNTPGLQFAKGDLTLAYSQEFGSNIASSQSVEITKGAILQHSLYSISSEDITPQKLSVAIDASYGSSEMYTFSQTKEQLVHAKVKIKDFSQIGNISFDDIGIAGDVYYWCKGEYRLFDEVITDDEVTYTNAANGAGTGLTYTFGNPVLNGDNTEFSIDIFTEATKSSEYSDAFIYINYNELGFGANAVANSAVAFTPDDLISNTDVYTALLSDEDINTLELLVFSISNP